MDNIRPSPENVYNEIDKISDWYRYIGTSGHKEAEDYIFSKFESLGLNTSIQEYTVSRRDGDVRGANVLGLLEGKTEPNKWLVIGGHYDTNMRTTHGAYDNAVGASSVIELARFFGEYYQTEDGPYNSILFACWDAEEGGGAGSSQFVNNLPEGIDVLANINLDMFSLNYPIRNNIPGATEEYYKLYLYTSPVKDFSGYNGADFDPSTLENFTVFRDLLENITYLKNECPTEWVLVMDDIEANSDHKFFIRNSIPAVWFRGLHEYPKDEGDLNERNFKHTPLDTLETMERYAGGKTELLKGIEIGLTLSYQLALGVLNLSKAADESLSEVVNNIDDGYIPDISLIQYLIALVVIVIIFISIYVYYIKTRKS
jgi:Zn-dependent M28 family amino/carboxypeptidase